MPGPEVARAGRPRPPVHPRRRRRLAAARSLGAVALAGVVLAPAPAPASTPPVERSGPPEVATPGARVSVPGPIEPAAPVVVWTPGDGPLDAAGWGARLATRLDRVVPFPWRRYVGALAVGCRPVGDLDCPGGVVEGGDRVTISPAAARWSDAALTYVLRHELAHVWQYATGDVAARRRDLVGVGGLGDTDPLEAAADCLAAVWGSPSDGAGYLACPAEGVRRMAEVFRSTPLPVPTPSGGPDAPPVAQPTAGPDAVRGPSPSSTARTAASVRPVTPSFR